MILYNKTISLILRAIYSIDQLTDNSCQRKIKPRKFSLLPSSKTVTSSEQPSKMQSSSRTTYNTLGLIFTGCCHVSDLTIVLSQLDPGLFWGGIPQQCTHPHLQALAIWAWTALPPTCTVCQNPNSCFKVRLKGPLLWEAASDVSRQNLCLHLPPQHVY